VFGIDGWLAQLAQGESLALVLLVALLLGLRHASDPDHLAAVSTLIASDPEEGTRTAGRLGLAWGAGHALTLAAFGLPIVLLGAYLPNAAQRAAEAAVGVMIMFLAIRLLLRWRSGHFHAHAHRHGDLEHRHLHPHHARPHGPAHDAGRPAHDHTRQPAHPTHDHTHQPEARLGRSPWQAFGIGLVHGTGGSAGVGVLLIATIPVRTEAVAALMVLAAGTAVSMALLSSAFGYAITRGPVLTRMLAFAPAMGIVTLAFGGWYTLGAVGAVPYLL
jgi:ABC-type nickel/cobalt efflux system permease component RcnA